MPLPTTPGLADRRHERRHPGVLGRLVRDSVYSLSALPIGMVTFTLVVVGLALGAGLMIIWVGPLVVAGTLLAARLFANLERLRLRSLQDRPAPLPAYARADPEHGWFRRAVTPLRDLQSWLDALWGVVGFATGLAAFVVTLVWWVSAGAGLTFWFWERWVPEGDTTLAELIGLGEGRTPETWLNLGLGVFALLTLPLVVRGVAALHAGTASALLDGKARLES